MTLRIEIKVVPYGNEDAVYPLAKLDISSVREIEDLGFGHRVCEYEVELYSLVPYANAEEVAVTGTIVHNRRDGAIALAEKACALMKDRF